MSAESTAPWWQTSLWITAAVIVLALVALYAPWPINAVAVLGAVVCLFLTLRDPNLWLRWSARTCITAAAATAALPDFAGRVELEWGFVEFSQSPALAYALLVTGVALAALDVWRPRPVAPPHRADDDEQPIRDEPKDPLDPDLHTYFTSAVAMHKTISLAGFETKLRAQIRLEDLHIPLNAFLDGDAHEDAPALSAKEAKARIGERGKHRELPLSDAFRFAQRHGERRGLVILGDPGSGKTTHLAATRLAGVDAGL